MYGTTYKADANAAVVQHWSCLAVGPRLKSYRSTEAEAQALPTLQVSRIGYCDTLGQRYHSGDI